MADLILASSSPRRLQLLEQLGLTVEVVIRSIDESAIEAELPLDYVSRLAKEKAEAVASISVGSLLPIIAADTVVEQEGLLLGKPKGQSDAFSMWRRLSNSEHNVHTAMAMIYHGKCSIKVSSSTVRFKILNEQEMLSYWATGEPADKAGAYAVQGFAACWIEKICGSYSGIMGLDIFQATRLLEKTGIRIF